MKDLLNRYIITLILVVGQTSSLNTRKSSSPPSIDRKSLEINSLFVSASGNERNSTDMRDIQIDSNNSINISTIVTSELQQLIIDIESALKSATYETESGRLFFYKGMKKIMWTIFVGLQVVKTILLALFLPSILGSLGKMVGKGISSVSGYNQPTDVIHDLDFNHNSFTVNQEAKYNDYEYSHGEDSNQYTAQKNGILFDLNNPVSRLGSSDQKLTHINSPINSNINLYSGMKNNFESFLDIPASSLLLTNYDPFYSPLLSRLDAVFQQIGLQKKSEVCRKKIVCLMYSNPAKYAPYSNLVSAQLSRELNELRKPTVDNPEILRFFEYMKAAKDGQDGLDCKSIYKECVDLKETDNPVMLSTYNDINKLVRARELRDIWISL